MNLESIIIAFIASLPGIIALLVQDRRDRNVPRVNKADAEDKEAAAEERRANIRKLEDDITQRVLEREQAGRAALEERITKLEVKLQAVGSGAWRLHDQVINDYRGTPAYVPPIELRPSGPLKPSAVG